MKEAVIKIDPAAGGSYLVELLELKNGALSQSGPHGNMTWDAATLLRLADVLTGNTPPAGLEAEGRALHAALSRALGADLQGFLDGPECSIYFDITPNELQKLPWEILVWPKTIAGGVAWTSVSRKHHLSRTFNPNWASAPVLAEGPMRLLLVVGSDATDPDVNAEFEEEEIRRTVHEAGPAIDIESVRQPSQYALYETMKQFRPHILHFIGHATNAPPSLTFQGWDWDSGTIVADVGGYNLDGWTPHLAFLNACRSGSSPGQLAALSGAFLSHGCHTIAMQGNIKGKTAGTLAGEFYKFVAEGMALDHALSRARGKVAQVADNKQAAFPALTLRSAPYAALPTFQAPADDYRNRSRDCELLATLKVFVNQTNPRRNICSSLWPFKGENVERFILLRGATGFGKTALSTWLLDLSVRLGHRVRYVQVGASGPVDFLKVLDLIWGASQPPPNASPLFDPLPLAPNPELQRLINDPKSLSMYAAVYDAFRKALAETSKEQPLTLILDEFRSAMDIGSFWIFWEHLLVPLKRDMPNVNILMVLNDDEYVSTYDIEDQLSQRQGLKAARTNVKLEELRQADFVQLLSDYLYLRSENFRDPELKEGILRLMALTPRNYQKDRKPLSIARLEEKAVELASVLDFKLERLRPR